MKDRPEIVIRIDRRAFSACLVLFLLTASALKVSSESLSLTATYPAPVGVYNQLITTGNGPTDTKLGLNAGNVLLAPSATGRVGVGTSAPAVKLDVAGNVRVTGSVQVVDGNQAAGKVLVGDSNGTAGWGYCTYAP